MLDTINEIKQNLENHQSFVEWFLLNNYSQKTLEQCSRGELREALSYYPQLRTNNTKVEDIIKSIDHHKDYFWSQDNFNIIDEACLQCSLRKLGYDIKLLDHWPSNTLELGQHLIKIPQLNKIKNKILENIKKLFKINYHWIYAVFAILGIIYFHNLHLFIWSLIISYFAWLFMEVVKHEYLEHRYIVPRSKTIKYLVDWWLYFYNADTYADKNAVINLHMEHHVFWKTDRDQFSKNIEKGMIYSLWNFNIFNSPAKDTMEKIAKEYSTVSNLFVYLNEIKLAIFLLFALVFGIEYFFYLMFMPLFLRIVFEGQHDWYLINFGERNYWFLYPLALNQSWHLDHHLNYKKIPASWDDLFNGPLWIKYINPQYYIARLLFKFKH